MVFVDSNIPMYLVGAPHPNKEPAEKVLRRLLNGERTLVTDAEVFQEILHRYTAIRRRDAIEPAFRLLEEIIDTCLPITLDNVHRAKALLESHPGLTARDAVHLAVMEEHEVSEILTFDAGFDTVPAVSRLPR